jgi:tRNA-dihydrouridine synthase B
MAPLQGVTGYPFRNVWQRHFSGLDEAVTPFLPAVTGLRVRDCHLRDVLPGNHQGSMVLVPQIMGNSGPAILRTAEAMAGLGYREVNLNMGCPSATVTRKRRGCGMLPYPEMIGALLDEVMPRMPLSLSVKIRLGMHSHEEVWPVLDQLNRHNLSRIIVHPRLGAQQYDGVPDLETFAGIITATPHEMVYNGDINTTIFFRELRDRFPRVKQWMIGRGLLLNPFLPGMIHGMSLPENGERRQTLQTFHHELMDAHRSEGLSPGRIAARTKEYWFYFSHWFKNRHHVWHTVSRATDDAGLEEAIREAFRGEIADFS